MVYWFATCFDGFALPSQCLTTLRSAQTTFNDVRIHHSMCLFPVVGHPSQSYRATRSVRSNYHKSKRVHRMACWNNTIRDVVCVLPCLLCFHLLISICQGNRQYSSGFPAHGSYWHDSLGTPRSYRWTESEHQYA